MSLILIDIGGTTVNLKIFNKDMQNDYMVCVRAKSYSSKGSWEELFKLE